VPVAPAVSARVAAGGIRDKGDDVLRSCSVVPFHSPTGVFDPQDKRVSTLGSNLFRGSVLAVGGEALCDGGFGGSNDGRGSSLDTRARSNPAAVDVAACPW
jgi:hypothetical protein